MTADTPTRPTVGQMVWHQFRYQNKIFWRTPIAAFFTIVFPLLLLVLFTALFGNETIEAYGITTAQYYTPGLAVFAAMSASYTNLAIGTAIARDGLILKRIRGTPIPPWAYLTGRVVSAIYLAFIALVLMMLVGVIFYGIQVYPRTLPSAIVTFLVGVGCFSALGMLVAALSPSGEAAPAITNATLLPIAFISDIFIPIEDPPAWMEVAGSIFPLKAFAVAFRDAFDPNLTGAQFHWPELGLMLAWGVAATLLAIRLFKWEPAAGRSRGPRRQRQPAEGET
ncbi:MAG: ABC transporter permease [Actinobacteria bacterium]|nr:ABC transporter permease [Actinomycetota bacterium]MCI0544013.1 ABC transporter permease [Actinomycetota bacterium]MCI0679149.1 ABC transporter permease [Actinomycetota bacterium]